MHPADPATAGPRLAYVIPAFNAARTLPATLRSLLAQSERAWEAVVVDDGSTDDTAGCVARLADPRITLLARANAGPAAAREAGAACARADRLAFLDADDTVDPDHARLLLGALGEADAVACGLVAVDEHGRELALRQVPRADAGTFESVLEGNPFQFATVAIRRRVLDRVIARFGSLMDRGCHCEDWEFWMRVASVGCVWAPPVEQVLVRYTRTSGTRSRHLLANLTSGVAALRTHARSPDEAARYVRRFAVRTLGRAVAMGDMAVADAARAISGPIADADDDVLAESIRGGTMLDRPSDAGAWRTLLDQTLAHIRAIMPDHPRPVELAFRASVTGEGWALVAQRALDIAGPGRTLVLFGLGQNGVEVARHLPSGAQRVAFIDDNPQTQSPLARLSLSQLGERHVVLVTPIHRTAILSRLAACGPARVLLPEQLACA